MKAPKGSPAPPPNPKAERSNGPVRVRADAKITISLDGPILKMLDELHPVYGTRIEDRVVTLLRRELIRLLEDDLPVFDVEPPEPEA